MAKVEQLYALEAYYRVVYLDGLNHPVEILLGCDTLLATNDPGVLDSVAEFIQQTIDLDCRRVLFIYLESQHHTSQSDETLE